MHIWVDADACPGVIKEILFRVADRMQISMISWINCAAVALKPAVPLLSTSATGMRLPVSLIGI
jgi:uncharacterized protein YaiI (UPF0178 family)